MPKSFVSPATTVSDLSQSSPRLEAQDPIASVGDGTSLASNGALVPPSGDGAAAAAKKPKLTTRLTRMFSQNKASIAKDVDPAATASENSHGGGAGGAGGKTASDRDHLAVTGRAPSRGGSRGNTPESDKKSSSTMAAGGGGGGGKGAKEAADVWRRFEILPDGNHEHHLKAIKRQEKLSDMLRDLLGGKRRGDEQVAPPPPQQAAAAAALPPAAEEQRLSLMSGWVDQFRRERDRLATDKSGGPNATASLVEKYGRCQEVVGRGAFGIVRVAHKTDPLDGKAEQLYAVKEFRRRPQESPKRYQKRLTSEFCISASLRHPNVIHTLDLLQDAKGDYCEVMEFCAGGDLYSLILAAGKLEVAEADCFFKQLMRGVEYMHEMGVAHRDLKPENLLLTTHGSLKITDFGNGECFRMAWETDARMTAGLCGSAPYIAPEEYTAPEFDPRAVDVWACGVIYMAMRTGRHLWTAAKDESSAAAAASASAAADADEFYERYLEGRRDEAGYAPIESLHRARCRNVIYSILDPNPGRRITASQVLKSEWGREIRLCRAGEEGF